MHLRTLPLRLLNRNTIISNIARSRFSISTKRKMPIQRITMFKVPDPANVQPILDAYKVVETSNQKDGKPYILSCKAGKAIDDPRSQGYDLVAYTTFETLDDMKYYDESCEAHQQLKATAKGKVGGPPLCVYFEG